MSELTIHTGGQGEWTTIHVAWHDENNVPQHTRIDLVMLPQDKPRTLTLRVQGVVVATIPSTYP